jgi:hypothetical protein
MWTFETKWPAPFVPTWVQSEQRFDNATDAAKAAAEWLALSADCGTLMEVRHRAT